MTTRERPAWSVLALSLLTLIPLAVVLGSWLHPQPEVWQHLRAYVLPAVLRNTAIMAVGVAFMVGLLGVSLAWLTALCEFPGRRFFSWALILPLALPAYVLAAVEVGLLDYSGALQTFLRDTLGLRNATTSRHAADRARRKLRFRLVVVDMMNASSMGSLKSLQ